MEERVVSNDEAPRSKLGFSTKRNYRGMALLAEWSKAADLSSVIFGCVGSNPTECNQHTHTHIKYWVNGLVA